MTGYHNELRQSGHLDVGQGHELWYEVCGQPYRPQGKSVVFLHGGPGGGISEEDRCYFDPQVYHIVLFDQRGAGKSTPHASIEHNTTWDLVEDIERLREHLNVKTWLVFGGSWGSTLALAYAERHAERVKGLILRGIFTLRQSELEWFYESGGAQHIFPDAYNKYISEISEDELRRHGGPQQSYIQAYHALLNGPDEARAIKAAKAWGVWELSVSKLVPDQAAIDRAGNDSWALAFARIENHYFINHGWLQPDDQLLQDARIFTERKIPMTIVQGRYDIVCPAKTAWDLHNICPHAEFVWCERSGHSAREPEVRAALIKAADKYRSL